jgi:serine/threonine-protein kinase
MASDDDPPTHPSSGIGWLRSEVGPKPGAETDQVARPDVIDDSDADCEGRECRKALVAEEGTPTPGSKSGPSSEFAEQAAQRLALMCALIGVVAAFMGTLNAILYHALEWTAPQYLGLLHLANGALILLSVLVYAAARTARLSPRAKLHVGLAYQVLGGFAIAMPSYYCPSVIPQHDLGHVSWLCVWITFFPLVAPAPFRPAALAGVLTASTAPLALFLLRSPEIPLPGTQVLFETFAPNYICAAISLAPMYVMQELGRQVSQARREARRLGSYQLIERLGRGGMGEVWRAEHSMLARPAAIKLVRSELLGAAGDPEEQKTVLARFEREARSTAALRSPHTVSLYDFGVADDGAFYYVMELLEGLDLETLVDRYGPLPPARVVHLLAQACDSLAEAHSVGLVHRDVKPANIYACRLGLEVDFVKVLDFGLVAGAQFARAPGAARLTGQGFIVGTPAFMAPEMVSEGEVDARADIYALGCVAYWLLTGKQVFESDKPMQIMIDHARTAPVAPSRRFNRPIPPAVEAAVMACLSKDKAARPTDALDLKRRLLEAIPADQRWTQDHARGWWAANVPTLTGPIGPLDPTRMPRSPGLPTAEPAMPALPAG